MCRVYLCGMWVWMTSFPLPYKVPSPKCWGSERLNSSNNGFPSQNYLVKRCVTPICPGQFAFISLLFLIDITSSSFPFLRGGSGIWPRDHNNFQGSYTVALVCGMDHIQRDISGLPCATPGFHTPPAPTHTRSALHRKFTALWPHVKVPF